MITWVTVWVLTVYSGNGHGGYTSTQWQYATQKTCEIQRKKFDPYYSRTACNFQQVPVYVPKGASK